MKIQTESVDKSTEKIEDEVKKEDKLIKSEDVSQKSSEISFEVGDFCLVKRPADNNWRTYWIMFLFYIDFEQTELLMYSFEYVYMQTSVNFFDFF